MNLLSLLLILLGIILGVVGGYVVARNLLLQKQSQARQTAEDIVNQAHKEADNIKKEKLLEAKEENQILREQPKQNYEKDVANFKDKKPDFFKKKKT